MKKEQHIFALFDEQLVSADTARSYTITDRELSHRISRVLRLDVGDIITLFNRHLFASATIQAIAKGVITVQLAPTESVIIWYPAITFLLPLLKKDALVDAVYRLVEAGVTTIQLVTTQKTQRAWGGNLELDRLSRVVIAAAEQSKYFAFPIIREPISLSAALEHLGHESKRYYGNPEGQSFVQVVSPADKRAHDIVLLVGPEGDLTSDEKQLVAMNKFIPVALTPTILRAESAAFSMAILFRAAL